MSHNSLLHTLFRTLLPRLGLVLICAVILTFTIRGRAGNPTSVDLNDPIWKDEGPLELSPERGRFALMYSILEDHSFQFTLPVARFAAPDVAISNGRFVSIFAPALSFMIMPGYMIGKVFGLAQVGSYAIISLFAVLNVVFIKVIAQRLGAHPVAAAIGGLIYLFGTPAFAYSVSLYQHQVSTFLILSSIYVLLRWKNWASLVYIWLACAFSIMLDNPNLFFMFPIGIFALTRLVNLQETARNWVLNINPKGFLTLLVMIIPLALFMFINKLSYGNPFQLAGTVASGDQILSKLNDSNDLIEQVQAEKDAEVASASASLKQPPKKKSALSFFETRQLPNGLYIHLLSPDRGIRMYAPLMFVGFIGILLLAKTHESYFRLLLATCSVVLLLYSMWGDPYGGWAFGSRYMIPAYAILSIGLGVFLSRFKHSILILLFVLGLSGFSVFVNTIGAITSNRMPPQVQVLALEQLSGRQERYTFTRGMQMLNENKSKSFFFQEVGNRYFTAWEFAIGIMSFTTFIIFLMLIKLFLSERQKSAPKRTNIFAKLK